jgi:hypothetical protein
MIMCSSVCLLFLNRSFYLGRKICKFKMAQQKDNEVGSLSGGPDMDNLAVMRHTQELGVATHLFLRRV